jgi:hydrophobic/amphiphilic exporter-1 (mainly G- bacteria), HAE1 family
VISIVLVLVGSLTVLNLPVAQFPNIAPPEIQILATYVGADAQTLEQAVATPLEQQMNGVDNMNYMYSLNATGSSSTSLIVNFDQKTDPNTDFILAQSRETQAASQLPAEVTNYGITVRKSVTAPLVLIAVYSPHGTYDATFLANYAYINLADPVLRSSGIGNVQVFGAGQYAPQGSHQKRPMVVTSKPANGTWPGTRLFYSDASCGGKSVLVRQLRGPHLSTWP